MEIALTIGIVSGLAAAIAITFGGKDKNLNNDIEIKPRENKPKTNNDEIKHHVAEIKKRILDNEEKKSAEDTKERILESYKNRPNKKEPIKKPRRMSYHDKVKKGADYEKFIADQYRAKGYTIWEHGADKGLKDMSIDIIAKRNKELLLIQCKNWNEKNKYRIKQKDIKALRADARDFVKLNRDR
ncbi:MAG: restriction endonuclease [Campylobacterota bacterium]|nr:restriction endonuclease [Campylobacterota bacterium]